MDAGAGTMTSVSDLPALTAFNCSGERQTSCRCPLLLDIYEMYPLKLRTSAAEAVRMFGAYSTVPFGQLLSPNCSRTYPRGVVACVIPDCGCTYTAPGGGIGLAGTTTHPCRTNAAAAAARPFDRKLMIPPRPCGQKMIEFQAERKRFSLPLHLFTLYTFWPFCQ